ncbi:MAG: histidine phosphatase family protein [Ruminococcus sp.]
MKIYSTRHGQTDYNLKDIIQGTTDNELNDTGISQAYELAEKVSQKADIDLIISSPMKRAYRTACIISEKNNLDIITDERLREWDYGRYEGMPRTASGFAENKSQFGVRMGTDGESVLQLAHRVYSALDDIIKNYPDKNILIVCHGGVCRIIETYFHDLATEDYNNWFMGNCELIEYNI